MKVIILISGVTIVIILSGILINSYLDKSSKIIENGIDRIEADIRERDWEAAKLDFTQVSSKWNKTKIIWSMLVDHIEVDNIDSTLSRIQSHIQTRDYSLSLSEISALRLFVEHIPEKEALSLKNIF